MKKVWMFILISVGIALFTGFMTGGINSIPSYSLIGNKDYDKSPIIENNGNYIIEGDIILSKKRNNHIEIMKNFFDKRKPSLRMVSVNKDHDNKTPFNEGI